VHVIIFMFGERNGKYMYLTYYNYCTGNTPCLRILSSGSGYHKLNYQLVDNSEIPTVFNLLIED